MPIYEYECSTHGSFETLRPMSESSLPKECPRCHRMAARVILTAAALACMPASARQAHATNERSANQPKSTRDSRHGRGCGCCGGKSPRIGGAESAPKAAKAFPSKRPWMISH
jgi:putative FmdB family regulatory protein